MLMFIFAQNQKKLLIMATTIVKGWTKEFCYKKLAESFDFASNDIDDLGVTRLADGVYELTATHAGA